MSHPFIHILCVCLDFFKAGWSKKADPFKFSMLQPGRELCQGRGALIGHKTENKAND